MSRAAAYSDGIRPCRAAAPLDYWQVECTHVADLIGVEDAAIYLNDPYFEAAPQRTSLASFQRAWAATGHLAAILVPRP